LAVEIEVQGVFRGVGVLEVEVEVEMVLLGVLRVVLVEVELR